MSSLGRTPVWVQVTCRNTVPLAELERRLRSSGPKQVVLVRDKDLPRVERAAYARTVARLARRFGHDLVIAEDPDLATELGADGLHLSAEAANGWTGASVRPEGWLSRSCHSVREVLACDGGPWTSLFLSPIFASPRKGDPLGLGALSEARRGLTAGKGLIALGGITADRVGPCLVAGASGVASIRFALAEAAGKVN